jgi:hypothetical protein
MGTIAAAGPDTEYLLPANIAATNPPIAAVYNPHTGGTPVAIANARDRGIATMPVITPAVRSATSLCFVYPTISSYDLFNAHDQYPDWK